MEKNKADKMGLKQENEINSIMHNADMAITQMTPRLPSMMPRTLNSVTKSQY